MKTILIFLTVIMLGFNSTSTLVESYDISTTKDVNILTFDGYEGEYFFFTDHNQKALILEKSYQTELNSKLLEKNNNTGKRFRVTYLASDIEEDSSSQGTILSVEKI
ncbi:hypothetical protein [Dokdonia sp. Hel_I_53]|uniref:hypothetical protein n=1 Tax=Dokdonia sp. Hel_I_53 TaxID=1566287 RepID=UPI00119BC798|nr:hypothetical protein [Dokdonia sp. Hel_I_53]TVZ52507.1 hypothetical protein OD90_1683 [Dokdonia sp. Hel_I_53]